MPILLSRRALVITSALVGFSGTVGAADPLKIGVIVSYSGAYADYGKQMDGGMAVYLAETGGTLAGRPVTFIRKDTAGPAPDLANRFAKELIIRDKVDLIVGLDFSPNAIAIAPVLTEAKVVAVVMNAASAVIPSRSPYIVRTSFSLPQVSAPMAQWALTQGIKQISTIVSDYGPGQDAEKAFHAAFKAGGGTIANALRVPLSNPDFSAYVQRLKDEKPEAAFIFFPSGDQPTAFMRNFRERGLEAAGIKLLATGDATDDAFIASQGEDPAGLITSHHYSFAHPSPRNAAYTAAFRKIVGEMRPSYMSVAAYDGLALIDAALKKTGGKTDAPTLVEAMKGQALDSPRGPITIDPVTRDIVQTVYIRKAQRVNGQMVNVEFDAILAVQNPGVAP
jgi:branched-chain amino acid transport system substrate-binding protein